MAAEFPEITNFADCYFRRGWDLVGWIALGIDEVC
jgi:hypothetical protein